MKKDLIVLVADKDMQYSLKGLLERTQAIGIREIDYDIFIHPERDPGVFHKAGIFLRNYTNDYDYAMVFLDREGSGQENKSATEIADKIRNDLNINGWMSRNEVIVFDPELEIWVWVNSPHLPRNTGWESLEAIRSFLKEVGFWPEDRSKPVHPKEAFEQLLQNKRIPRSSSIYYQIASSASFRSCTDPTFHHFLSTLQNWFGMNS